MTKLKIFVDQWKLFKLKHKRKRKNEKKLNTILEKRQYQTF